MSSADHDNIEVKPRNTTRGRPRTTGSKRCARCQRYARKIRITWPEGDICGTCFHHAMRTHGQCLTCGHERLLPGYEPNTRSPICTSCAGIPPIRCDRCSVEAEHYRRGICARCALRDELSRLLLDRAKDPTAMTVLQEALVQADRPESMLSWMRSAETVALLGKLATGALPLTHEALDAEPSTRRVEHLRSILEHHGLLEQRDHHLALFERWLTSKLEQIQDPDVREPVARFANWHHLARIRRNSAPGIGSRGPVHSAKQEITETIKFLTWLREVHGRYVTDCRQGDVDEYLAAGPTTRTAIRTFFVWSHDTARLRGITIAHRKPRTTPRLSQDQRISWLRELLHGDAEALPYRLAGVLLLLYAQPLVRVAQLRIDDVVISSDAVSITFASEPVPVPEPFASMLRSHARSRPNQRGANASSEWLFPSNRAGRHLHANTVMDRLRQLGIDLLGARNSALRELVSEAPAPVVAKLLGYSYQVANKHSHEAASAMASYAAVVADGLASS